MKEEEDRRGPDEVVHELEGCGRFQMQFAVMIHTLNIVIVWCLHSMIFMTAVPKWWCTDVTSDNRLEETCIQQNETECSRFTFSEDMDTIVDVRYFISNDCLLSQK